MRFSAPTSGPSDDIGPSPYLARLSGSAFRAVAAGTRSSAFSGPLTIAKRPKSQHELEDCWFVVFGVKNVSDTEKAGEMEGKLS